MTEEGVSKQAIAGRLRQARKLAGLTQGQVAKILGWHRPTVSEIEAGRRRVSAEELSKLADIYGVNVPWVMGKDGNTEGNDVTARARMAARELSKLRDEDLERLLHLIRSLRVDEDEGP